MADFSVCGVFIELLTIDSTSTSGSKSYPMIPAGELRLFNVDTPGHSVTVDYDGSGYARVNWSGGGGFNQSTTVMIFAQALNEVNTYGATVRSSAGKVLLDYSYPVPQFKGTLTPSSQAAVTVQCPEGMRMHAHSFATNVGAGTNRIILLHAPDNGANVWYSYTSFLDADYSQVTLNIFAPNDTAYVVPTLHVFSLDGIVSAGSSHGLQLSRPDTSLVYDSSAENLTAHSLLPVIYPPPGSVNSYIDSTPILAGILAPYYENTTHTAVSGGWTKDRYVSGVRRSGNQFQFKQMWQSSELVTTVLPGPSHVNTNTFCIVVDVAHLSSGLSAGTPGAIAPNTYPSYNNPPNLDIEAFDTWPTYSIGSDTTTAGSWHNGSGDSNLYEVMVTLTGGTYVKSHSHYADVGVWYSLHATSTWSQSAPPGNTSGLSRVGGFSYQIRIKSNQQVVVNSTFSLEYTKTF